MLLRFIAIFSLGLLAVPVHAADPSLKSQKDKVSYSIGLDIGKNLKNQGIDIDSTLVAKGIQDAVSGGKPMLTEEEVQGVMTQFSQEMQSKMAAKTKAAADKNQKEGESFLAENKKKKDVVTLPSGLQYKVIKAGNGKKPKSTDTVTTNYKGTLIDGTEFDSSYKRGEPASFPVSGVIPGWTEALQLMPVGSKWQLFVPPSLAYGPRGAGPQIGPNATLIFEVELLSIQEEGKAKP